MKITGEWISRKATQRIFGLLEAAGHEALFVGGCVRNALLSVPVADIDIATDAKPEEVVTLAEKAGLKVVPTGIDHGTVTVISDHIPHEVTTFRKDVETFGRHAVVSYTTAIEDDARRRDFTMNAIYARSDGTVIDPLSSAADLQSRRVRFVGDPAERIREDYLRILRFFRFHAWYGDPENGLDADGLSAVSANAQGLTKLSRERVGAEVLKLLGAPDPAPSVAAMRIAGILHIILPGSDDRALAPLVHLEQETGAGPNAPRRLTVLGGQDVADRLRLSKADAKRLDVLRTWASGSAGAGELGYRFGADMGRDVLLARAALLGQPLDPDIESDLAKGAAAKFPVTASDLMPVYSGPALGRRLEELEARWIASGFQLDRHDLLT